MKTDRAHAVPIVRWAPRAAQPKVTAFMARPAIEAQAEVVARQVLDAIRRRGDAAVLDYVRRFDKADLTVARLRVTPREIQAARRVVDAGFRAAARAAHESVAAFARAGLRPDWEVRLPGGGRLGETYAPLRRVGAYIPGGAAPLASTALMTVTLARVAGVAEIVACTPARADGSVNPYLLFALDLAGATEIYKVGGIQAIGAMAYGTRRIARVQKIVGPGGPYVTAAKKLVYGQVALDMVAGPSEIAILADASANPAHVAADLLSQAEHGTGSEKALLVTTSMRLARQVAVELGRQSALLARQAAVRRVLDRGALIVVAPSLAAGADLCAQFAPEHLELLVRDPRRWARKITTAGAIFIGPWTPESAGDFAAGPSHVLPTGGAAAMFSGLTVEDFRRRSSLIEFTRKDLARALPVIEAFGRVEGLDAHARSATIRFSNVWKTGG